MEILARAVGRRKEAVAQVQIVRGTGLFIINDKAANEYLHENLCSLKAIKAPFSVLEKNENQSVTPQGGKDLRGLGGQSLPNPQPTAQQTVRNQVPLPVASLLEQGSRNINAAILNLETLDTRVKVKGGGLIGQAEAIKLGIARALCDIESLAINSTKVEKQIDDSSNNLNRVKQKIPFSMQPVEKENNNENSSQNEIRKQLKTKGFLTQDSRVKERRKYGLKKARKASQYHKR